MRWEIIIRQEALPKVNDNTEFYLADMCLREIMRRFEKFDIRTPGIDFHQKGYYQFDFNGYPFAATYTKGYINGELVDVLQVAAEFRELL